MLFVLAVRGLLQLDDAGRLSGLAHTRIVAQPRLALRRRRRLSFNEAQQPLSLNRGELDADALERLLGLIEATQPSPAKS